MKISFLFFFIITGINTFSQAYTPLLDNYNEWHFTTCFTSCPIDIYYTDGDTVVNGIDHKILNGYHFISRTFLLSEDTTARTVSLTTVDGKIDTYLLYDFSLNVGDSIDIQNPISPFPDSPGYFRVDSIQMKALNNGNDYKLFYLSVINPFPGVSNAVWIEGVGSLSLINAPGGLNDINGAGHLSCFFKDGFGHYSNLDSISQCTQAYFPTSIKETDEIEVSIVPNPTYDNINVWTNYPIDQIEIINLAGQMIYSSSDNKILSRELDIDFLDSGIYLIHISFASNTSVIRRLVKL